MPGSRLIRSREALRGLAGPGRWQPTRLDTQARFLHPWTAKRPDSRPPNPTRLAATHPAGEKRLDKKATQKDPKHGDPKPAPSTDKDVDVPSPK